MTHHLTEPITCQECHGTGDDADQPWRPCPFCYGQGIKHITRPPNAPALRDPVDEPPGRDL